MRAILLTLFLAVLGCESKQVETVPDDMVGVWETSSKRYADRTFTLTESTIRFGTGDGQAVTHPILRVERHSGSRYTIHYENDDEQEYSLSVFHEPNNGTVRFEHQMKVVWKKRPEPELD